MLSRVQRARHELLIRALLHRFDRVLWAAAIERRVGKL